LAVDTHPQVDAAITFLEEGAAVLTFMQDNNLAGVLLRFLDHDGMDLVEQVHAASSG